jgi:hypothetical protein
MSLNFLIVTLVPGHKLRLCIHLAAEETIVDGRSDHLPPSEEFLLGLAAHGGRDGGHHTLDPHCRTVANSEDHLGVGVVVSKLFVEGRSREIDGRPFTLRAHHH